MIVAAAVVLSFAPCAPISIGAANSAAAAASNASRMALLANERRRKKEQQEREDAEAAAVAQSAMPPSAFPSRFASCPSRAHDPLGYEECAKMVRREDINNYLSSDDIVGIVCFGMLAIALVLAFVFASRY